MSEDNILQLIPQRPPFVMIDKLIHSQNHVAQTTFRVTADNILVINGKFSEAGLLENIAQSAAAWAAAKPKNINPVHGYIGAVNDLEISSLPEIDDLLITDITMDDEIFDFAIITGKITCNNLIVAQCQMKIFIGKS